MKGKAWPFLQLCVEMMAMHCHIQPSDFKLATLVLDLKIRIGKGEVIYSPHAFGTQLNKSLRQPSQRCVTCTTHDFNLNCCYEEI